MTENNLDQILKQALAPEIDDSEIQIQRKVSNKKMNRKRIIAYGLAACIALSLIAFGGNWGRGLRAGENTASVAETESGTANANVFAITAYAAELPEGVKSGDVTGIRRVEAGYGNESFLDGRFFISGQNIERIKVTTDKCEIYTSVPVYSGDPDYENAAGFEPNDNEFYEEVFKEGDPGSDQLELEYYDHIRIVGESYEGEYNASMSVGISIPEELHIAGDDDKDSFWKSIDQADGAVLTVEATFLDGSTETHHYKLNTGKIYVPAEEDGTLHWDQLTRFLTSDEEKAGTPFIYGYLMEKMD